MGRNSSVSVTKRSANTPRATLRPPTAKDSLLHTYATLLVNRRDRHLATATDGGWYSAQRTLTNRLLEAALRGHSSIGLYATAEDGLSKWLCLDADDDATAHKLHHAARMLPANTFFIERSRRGIHLFRVFDPPAPWAAVRRYGVSFAAKAGCAAIEVFPKNGTFSAVRAPMTVHPTTRRLYDWLDVDGALLDPWDTLLTLAPTPIPDHWLKEPQPEPRSLAKALPFGQFPTPSGTHAELLAEVSRYTTLKHLRAERYVGKCVFHAPDNHPSLGISARLWQCWTCRIGGYLDDFRQEIHQRGLGQHLSPFFFTPKEATDARLGQT